MPAYLLKAGSIGLQIPIENSILRQRGSYCGPAVKTVLAYK
jgi:hypothetical protein